jgi:ribonuclease T2
MFRMGRTWLAAAAALLLASTLTLEGKKKAAPKSNFSYYLLALSYVPSFCGQLSGSKDPLECGAGRSAGFVVHGLWPQMETGRGPEHCSSASPVRENLVAAMLSYIPTPSLIQHEWATHGVCTGLAAEDYFALVRQARDKVTIPSDLVHPTTKLQLSPEDIRSKFAVANRQFPSGAFSVSCYREGDLQEIRICFDKDLSPRSCKSSDGVCPLRSVMLLPVR